MRNLITTALLFVALASPAVQAKPEVQVSMSAKKEVIVNENGASVPKLVETSDISPGEVIVYTISYTNVGDEAAKDVAVDDPIPRGTAYIAGSAFGAGAEIVFSADKGKTFRKASLLTYEVEVNGKKQKQIASPDTYTNVRWVIKEVKPGAKGQVGFKVKVQ